MQQQLTTPGNDTLAARRLQSDSSAAVAGAASNLSAITRWTSRSIVISSALEVHECWQPDACVMSEAERSFGCAEGYLPTGSFCGVCGRDYARSGRACGRCPLAALRRLNWFVVSLLQVGLLALGVWAAGRKLRESDPQAPIMRIGLNYVQILGTLATGFLSRGTQTFRDIFGFAEATSGGPLTIAPVSCALDLSWYLRFALTLMLPFIMVLSVVAARSLMNCVARYRKRRSVRLQPAGVANTSASPASAAALRFAIRPQARNAVSPRDAAAGAASTPRQNVSAPTADANSAVDALATVQTTRKCRIFSHLWAALTNPLYVGPVVFVLSLAYTVRHCCYNVIATQWQPMQL